MWFLLLLSVCVCVCLCIFVVFEECNFLTEVKLFDQYWNIGAFHAYIQTKSASYIMYDIFLFMRDELLVLVFLHTFFSFYVSIYIYIYFTFWCWYKMWISEFSLSLRQICVSTLVRWEEEGELLHLLSLAITSLKECVHRVSISMTKTMNDNEKQANKKHQTRWEKIFS